MRPSLDLRADEIRSTVATGHMRLVSLTAYACLSPGPSDLEQESTASLGSFEPLDWAGWRIMQHGCGYECRTHAKTD